LNTREINAVAEGFDKPEIWDVFSAGVPICWDDKAEDGLKNSFESLLMSG
jgi:hypothetical protein